MARCDHAELFETHQYCLADTDRLGRLMVDLDATRQYPLTILFMGGVEKRLALRNLFQHRGRRHPVANIHVVPDTVESTTPIYYIDVDRNARPRNKNGPDMAKCHEIRSHKIEWLPNGDSTETRLPVPLQDLVFARLLFLITDVICIFADDLGGLAVVESLLAVWVGCGQASLLPSSVKPRVVILTSESGPALQLQSESILSMAQEKEFRTAFSAIRIEHTDGPSLRSVLFDEEMKFAYLAKLAAKLLFSASHIRWIYRQALQHFCRSTSPFDHYECFLCPPSSRLQLFTHMDTFLRNVVELKPPTNAIVSYLASSMLVDMYPRGGHAFAPNTLFDVAFQSQFKRMVETNPINDSLPDLILQVRHAVSEFAGPLHAGVDAHAIHCRNLLSLAGRLPWSELQSNSSCLVCLKRLPEHCMDCRHALCDACVVSCGDIVTAQEYVYHLKKCPLCLRPTDTLVMLKPPTAGIRLLSIDGGGVRGIVPLSFMRNVEKELDTTCGLQEFFDLAIGSSSGGLITLGLFDMKWPLTKCIDKFERLAYDTFIPQEPTLSWLSSMKIYIAGVAQDSMYDVNKYETLLRTQFGHYKRLFDSPSDGCSRYKIAVTATNISDSSTFVLSNYNGHDASHGRNGYVHVGAQAAPEDLLTWHAARATTAAPFLFPPVALHIGTLQDGGTREHNNPTRLAMWEARQIWPDTVLDVVLSLGTGSSASTSPQAPAYRNILKDGSITRTIRSYLSGIDGEVQSWNTVNSLDSDTKTGWFRLNIRSDVRLDDAKAMPILRDSVHMHSSQDSQILGLRRALIASCFFFELIAPPQLEDGIWLCTGQVRIRGNAMAVLRALHLMTPSSRLFKGKHLLAEIRGLEELCAQEVCPQCRCFSKLVRFTVRHLEEKVTIALQICNAEQRISGFPQTMAWFMQQQGITTYGFDSQKNCHCRLAAECLAPNGPKRNRDGQMRYQTRQSVKRRKLNWAQSWL